MKSFQHFQEDVNQLRRDLYDLDRQDEPVERLRSRRTEAKAKSKETSKRFKQRTLEKQQQIKNKQQELMQSVREKEAEVKKKKDSK